MVKRVIVCRSNPVTPDPRVEKEARCLMQAGYQVDIICWDRSGELPTFETLENGTLRRLPIRADYARGLMNFFPLLRWEIRLLIWLLRQNKNFDVIHACDFDTILPALACKVLFKKTVVYDIFDFYADHLRATPEWIKGLIRSIDLWSITISDAVILVDEARREQISGSRPKLLEIIYNSPEDGSRLKKGNLFDESANKPVLRLAYVGLLQYERGLSYVLEALQSEPDWIFDLAGFGGDETEILRIVKNMPNVTWHGRVSYETAISLSERADVLFALYDPEIPNHRYASPNKLFEAMMLGKPIIVSRGTNMDRIAAEYGFGLLIEYGNTKAFQEALHELANKGLRESLGKRARLAYENIYGWHIMSQRLVDLYGKIT